jgi:carotenoid cleavage dioxygenase-like enzyme
MSNSYSIFMDLPVVFRKEGMARGKSALVFDHQKKSRFGILPRHAESDTAIRWFELPAMYIFHTVCAFCY